MAGTEEIAEYNKPITSDKDFTVIKQKYMEITKTTKITTFLMAILLLL